MTHVGQANCALDAKAPHAANPTLRFAFFGGNSQVAIETALILQQMGHEVMLYGRGMYPQFPLAIYGLNYQQENPNPETQRALLANVNAVVEFAFPAGQPWEIVPQACARIDHLHKVTPPDAVLAHMSSISAYGMPSDDATLRWWRWPATTYAAGKRAVERHAQRIQRLGGVYSFRLGQVHGVLQSVSLEYRTAVRWSHLLINGDLDGASATLFCETVALHLVACARRTFQPGIWPLLSTNQWSVRELLAFYSSLENRHPTIDDRMTQTPSLKSRLWAAGKSLLLTHRDRIEPILFQFPKLAARVKARYRVQNVYATNVDESIRKLTCLTGDLRAAQPSVPSPCWQDTLENFRARELLLSHMLEQAMVHREFAAPNQSGAEGA